MMEKIKTRCVRCECIDTRVIPYLNEHRIVLDLEVEGEDYLLTEFFNCKSKSKGRYTVAPDGNFAKLMRLTLGEFPKKWFSEVQKHHRKLRGKFFIAEYDPSKPILKNGDYYFNVTSLKSENPVENEGWMNSGKLRKGRKKANFQHQKIAEKPRKSSEQIEKKLRKNSEKTENDKTLQTAKTLGLEPDLNQTYRHTNQRQADLPTYRGNITEPKTFHYSQHENETTDDFFDRVIGESNPFGLDENQEQLQPEFSRSLKDESSDDFFDMCISDTFDDQDESIREYLEERTAIMEFDGGLSRVDAEQAAASAIRVYCYRVTDKPDSELIAIMPNTELDEATEILRQKFGDRLLSVHEQPVFV